MTYNIHPILVHFPIALLFVYSIIKILPFKKWFASVAWKDIERIFLLLGVFGSFASLATGDTAEHIIKTNHQLVEMHATFAGLSTWIYSILLAGEVILILNISYQSLIKNEKIKTILNKIGNIINNEIISKILAILGFIAIFITGLLGGVITYGTSADPIAKIVLNLLGINY